MRRIPSRAWLFLVLLAASLLLPPAPANAQTALEVYTDYDYTFGEELVIRVSFPGENPPQQVNIFWHAQGENGDALEQLAPDEKGVYTFVLNLVQNPLRAFSAFSYWFRVVQSDGTMLTTEKESFLYEDDRFTWQTLSAGVFSVHWYEGDLDFAQEILNAAQAGLERAQMLLPTQLNPQTQFRIYAYKSARELQSTLQRSGRSWIAAHADPDLGMIMVSLPTGPDQSLEIERQVPHELMHLMLYQHLGSRYRSLPTWYQEGLASLNELYPTPEYALLLNDAFRSGSLIPLQDLCTEFPRAASSAILAYAESAAFASYLQQQHGSSGITALAQQYGNGLACEPGAQAALGKPLSRLERDWLEATFVGESWIDRLAPFIPWLILMAVLLAGPLLLSLLRRPSQDLFPTKPVR